MVQEIEKEVAENIDRLTLKAKRLGVKFISFIITSWLVIGTFGIGIVAPVYVVRSVMKINWIKEAQAANVSEKRPEITSGNAVMTSRWAQSNYAYSPLRSPAPQASVKGRLRETTDAVSQLRSLASGVKSLVSR